MTLGEFLKTANVDDAPLDLFGDLDAPLTLDLCVRHARLLSWDHASRFLLSPRGQEAYALARAATGETVAKTVSEAWDAQVAEGGRAYKAAHAIKAAAGLKPWETAPDGMHAEVRAAFRVYHVVKETAMSSYFRACEVAWTTRDQARAATWFAEYEKETKG